MVSPYHHIQFLSSHQGQPGFRGFVVEKHFDRLSETFRLFLVLPHYHTQDPVTGADFASNCFHLDRKTLRWELAHNLHHSLHQICSGQLLVLVLLLPVTSAPHVIHVCHSLHLPVSSANFVSHLKMTFCQSRERSGDSLAVTLIHRLAFGLETFVLVVGCGCQPAFLHLPTKRLLYSENVWSHQLYFLVEILALGTGSSSKTLFLFLALHRVFLPRMPLAEILHYRLKCLCCSVYQTVGLL